MSTKSHAHHSAKKMFKNDGVPWMVIWRKSCVNLRKLVKIQRSRYSSSDTIILGLTELKVRSDRIKELQYVQ